MTQAGPFNQIEVQPFYHDLRNQLVNPNDVLVCSHYFFREWKPRLGPVLSLLIMELRDRCYRNKATGEVRNTCWPSQTELARAMGVSVDTIARALKGELASLFVRVEPRYRYDPVRKKKIRTSSIYHVAMDEPLLPEDEAALHELLTRAETVDTSSTPQSADQDSSRKMRQEEGQEELNNVNDKKNRKPKENGKREYLAGELARQLADEKNLNYYRSIVEKFPEVLLFETLSIVKEVDRQGKVTKSRGALFVDLLKRQAQKRNMVSGAGGGGEKPLRSSSSADL
jgi:transcriptional regulator with XRE-family HTH domain